MEPIHRRRRWFTAVAAASLVVSGLGATGAAQAAPEGPSFEEKVDDQVRQELHAEGRADVWVRLAERADLSAAASIADWDARGQAVADALQATAEGSQKELRAELDDQGVEYQAFWATNSIRVSGADEDLVTSFASDSTVEGIYPTMQIEVPELVEDGAQKAPAAVEWGVNDIKAPQVWDEMGNRGEGIVVASIDTGVQYDHPALVNQYRGNNGDGTFDHNYNWYDAAGTSPSEPRDTNGHGSHVTGTMVGSDGGDNQIGVAPGATWIAANGCCPSDAALVNSGQWMLQPRDLQGENPDVSKRPDIINNSWGTTAPSNAPFMEDIIIAWAASGQFGVFANGNSGPGCQTSGSPGSRIVAYSVGNYNSSHTISSSSSRGAGQDGEIKPNISAPGSAVRSSVPGNGYANYSGTSMASPHVAGAVALAWSGAPALKHDVTLTRELLDGSATDTANDQCGGTAGDNNVFGEGRLNALQLLQDSPIGDTGTLAGTVTDAATGDPLADVSVAVVGPLTRNLVTNDQGAYNALLSTGDYDVTLSKFGYETMQTTVTIEKDSTATVNSALQPAPSSTVSGTVTDGSGYGSPLYARITADGTPVATYSDPATGEFSLDLPEGETFDLTAQVQYPGYTAPSTEVTVDGDLTLDIEVPVEAYACTAPGYEFVVDGVTESFDATTTPEGWTVEDYLGNGQVWRFDNPRNRANLTGGEGNFAIMDSDYYGSGGVQDTALVSPSVDMSALANPVVGFKQDYRPLGDRTDVDVSLDGGQTWTRVLAQTQASRGEQVVPLPMAAGEADVKVRFHHYQADWDWWWQVDDVFLGNRACAPTGEGGYVVGTVTGAESGEGIVGATVTNLDDEDEKAVTVATPSDDNLDDGFYWIFSDDPGTHPFAASARQFETKTQDVVVAHGDAVRADFVLGSGFVTITPTEIAGTHPLGTEGTHTLTVENTGSGAAEVELSEVAGDFTMLRADGSQASSSSAMRSAGDGGEIISIDAPTSFAAAPEGTSPQGAPDLTFAPNEEWVPLASYPRVVMDNRVVNLDGTWYSIGGTTGSASFADVYRYDTEGQTWASVAALPNARSAVTAGVVDGTLIVSGGWVSAGTTGETVMYDAGADTWNRVADNPVPVSAAGVAVLDGLLYSVGGCTTSACTPMSRAVTAYDPASDSWERLADYPRAAAFAACGAVDGELVCTGGNDGVSAHSASYAYDPAADEWSPLPDAPVDSWASQYATANGQLVVNGGVQGGSVTNATFAYDSTSGSWVTLPASSAAVYRGGAACGIAKVGGSTGGFTPIAAAEQLPGYTDCGTTGADVDWLNVDPMSFTVPAGESVDVTVTLDADVAQPGTYTAGIRVSTDTPQRLDPVPVSMTVTPPATWGKLLGTVTGTACDGTTAGVAGATVDVSPIRGTIGDGVTLATDENGGYAHWITSERGGHYSVIAAKDGYRPQTQQAQVKKGATSTVDFSITRTGC